MLKLSKEKIRTLTLSRSGAYQIVTRKEDSWTSTAPPHVAPNLEAINNILKVLQDLRASRLVNSDDQKPSSHGISDNSPTLTIGLTAEDRIQLSLLIGNSTGVGETYVSIQGQDILFVIPTHLAETLTKDLLL